MIFGGLFRRRTESRDDSTMRTWAAQAAPGTLRAVRAEAERDGDIDLVNVISTELERRGLA